VAVAVSEAPTRRAESRSDHLRVPAGWRHRKLGQLLADILVERLKIGEDRLAVSFRLVGVFARPSCSGSRISRGLGVVGGLADRFPDLRNLARQSVELMTERFRWCRRSRPRA
jgi:hypothetical protein